MKPCDRPFVITISHQVGSGGSFIGQKLAERLSIPFIDHEILQRVSRELHMAEGELKEREERLTSFWKSFGRMVAMTDPTRAVISDRYVPTDQELFETEADTIRKVAENSQAIFLGRCCRYVLRDHTCHFSLLVHADRPDRIQRLGALYHLSPAEAEKKLVELDRERNAYIRTFTRQDWLDARLYDLSLNTSTTGLEQASEIVNVAVLARLDR